jgi:hypothetical protein
VCTVVSFLAGEQVRARFNSTARFREDVSAQSRLGSWRAAWQMAWDHPFLGHGIRNSQQFIHQYGADHEGRTVHSQYLQIAADSGFPALLLYLAILGLSLSRLSRCRRMCLEYLQGGTESRPPPRDADPQIEQMAALALGLQGSLIIFVLGGVFLSLETFELPWLIITLAGLLPGVFERHLDALAAPTAALAASPAPPRPAAPRPAPRRWSRHRRALPPLPKGLAHS